MSLFEVVRKQKSVCFISLVASLTHLGCVESRVNQTSQISPVEKTQLISLDKVDIDRLERSFVGTWSQECDLSQSQRVTWNLDGSNFIQKVQIYMENGCPENSLAAEYKAKGTYHLGKVLDVQANVMEFDYVQQDYTLTIYHSVYLHAYNGNREYSHLPQYCKGKSFKRNVETSLVGLKCLEGESEYQKINPNSVFYSSFKIQAGKLFEASLDELNDGSAPNKRPHRFDGLVGYTKEISFDNPVKLSSSSNY